MSKNIPLIEYWIDQGGPIPLPADQGDTKRKWSGSVMYLDKEGMVHEYPCKAKSKLTLSQMLGFLSEKMSELAIENPQSCGLKVW